MTTPFAEAETSDPSYIDYEIFLSPSFSAPAFANSLVLTTNNPTDTPLDLATPLSRVLFDIQEVDSHIHTLTSSSALPLLKHAQSQTGSASRILTELSGQIASLNDSYKRLEKEVIERHEAAEEVRMVSERLWHTVRLGRAVGRALQLGRQLEVQMSEFQSAGVPVNTTSGPTSSAKPREDHRAMVRASNTILVLRSLFAASYSGGEGEGLFKVRVITSLRNDILQPFERTLSSKAQQVIREFSMSMLSSSTMTYAQSEDTKSRTMSALQTLYLLSPFPEFTSSHKGTLEFTPKIMLAALQDYIHAALTSSQASLVRALSSLPSLERTLLEISARCQNIIAMESLLESTKPPPLPSSASSYPVHPQEVHGNPPQRAQPQLTTPINFLAPLLQALETPSLPSYFWRSLGSALSPRVHELIAKGGLQARTLKTNRNSIRDAIRECVIRGSVTPGIGGGKGRKGGMGDKESIKEAVESWEREIAVMVGAVVGALGR
jgi:hypothetical protein